MKESPPLNVLRANGPLDSINFFNAALQRFTERKSEAEVEGKKAFMFLSNVFPKIAFAF